MQYIADSILQRLYNSSGLCKSTTATSIYLFMAMDILANFPHVLAHSQKKKTQK